jgi:hypothetical protein
MPAATANNFNPLLAPAADADAPTEESCESNPPLKEGISPAPLCWEEAGNSEAMCSSKIGASLKTPGFAAASLTAEAFAAF